MVVLVFHPDDVFGIAAQGFFHTDVFFHGLFFHGIVPNGVGSDGMCRPTDSALADTGFAACVLIQVERRLGESKHIVIEHRGGEDSQHNVGIFQSLVGKGEVFDKNPLIGGIG